MGTFFKIIERQNMQTKAYLNSVLTYADDKNRKHSINPKDILLLAETF